MSTHLKDVKNLDSSFIVQDPMVKISWGELTILGQGEEPVKTAYRNLRGRVTKVP